MKIWIATFEFPPDIGGGLSTYIREIVKLYANRKEHEITIFFSSPKSSRLQEVLVENNIRLVKFNAALQPYYDWLGHWTSVSNAFAEHMAMYALKEGPPDVIESADGFGIGYISLQKKLCLDSVFRTTPHVITAHTPIYLIDKFDNKTLFQLPNYWHMSMEKWTYLACDGVICPSQAILDVIENDLGKKLPNSIVLRNPFSIDSEVNNFKEYRRDHFFVASRLTHWKGIPTLVDSMSKIWADGIRVPLDIYGGDAYYQAANCNTSELLESKHQKWIEAGLLRLRGIKSRDEIDKNAQTALAQIHPSLFDNFPYSVVEGMANGGVCLVNKNGGHAEIIENGVNGYTYDAADSCTLKAAIENLLKLTDGDRLRIARGAHETISRECDPERYFIAKHQYLDEICRKKSGRRIFPFFSATPERTDQFRDRGNPGLLSVVIPFFNLAEYIDETVDSVMASTYPHLEIIIVDDGSSNDASVAKLRELEEKHSREKLRVIRQDNQGPAAARNTGAIAARGQFLALLDADDIVQPTYYERTVAILNAYQNVGFVGSWNEDFDDRGTIRVWPTFNTELPHQLIFNSTNCQGLVYWRELFLKHGQHDSDLQMFLDDWESTIALLAAGYHGVMIPEALFRYRVRSTSLFRSKMSLWYLNYEKITRKHAILFNKWGAQIAAFMNINGPNVHYHIPGLPSSYKGMNQKSIPNRRKFVRMLRFLGSWIFSKT